MADEVESLTRRAFLAGLAAVSLASRALAEAPIITPTFNVLSLFHPLRLILHAETASLLLEFDNASLPILRGQSLTIDANANRLAINDSAVGCLKIVSPATFAIEVPNKLRRTYRGTLAVTTESGHLCCVAGIERELAVASIVAAESPPHATADALAAQAIAARSFLLGAKTAHIGADFCDTTHCQFLREPPPADSQFAAAAQRTAGLVLQYRGASDGETRTLAAMYSRSCGGRTHTLAELGLPVKGYPYYAVECAFCRAHPELWQRDLAAATANSERARIDYNRIHGWSALPGHVDRTTALRIEGRGIGHGLGLCQLGAADMAARGATFANILAHYYPNTALVRTT
jgi:stage II sporulation protein D